MAAIVDAARRRAIERAHSATHLLHAALREHLGAHVQQRGSLVEADRLRFDFVHFEPMKPEEILLVENTVSEEILKSTPVEIAEKTLAEAKAMGAMALFGEKYGDVVRTVRMGDFSLELCGGTHLPTTSAAGAFRILSETGVSANVRRIEALVGLRALDYDRAQAQKLRDVAGVLGAKSENIESAAQKLVARNRELERELAAAQRKLAGGATDDILANAQESNGIRFVASRAASGFGQEFAARIGRYARRQTRWRGDFGFGKRGPRAVGRQSQQSRRGCGRARGQPREAIGNDDRRRRRRAPRFRAGGRQRRRKNR